MRMKRILALGLLTAVTAAAVCLNAAAAPRKKIESIKLLVEAEIQPGNSIDSQEAEITSKSSKYSVGEYKFVNDGFYWSEEDVPRLSVKLHAEDGFYFSVEDENFFIDGGAYVKQESGDYKETLIVTMDLQRVSEFTQNIEEIQWDSLTKVSWDSSTGAGGYEIRLYRDGKSLGSIKTTKDTSYDFSDVMKRAGVYSVKVRPVNMMKPDHKGEWTESPQKTVNEETARQLREAAGDMGWKQNETGWWYQRADGTYPRDAWEMIGYDWYYFDQNGYMATGWIDWNGNQYYCGQPDGRMLADTVTPDGFTVDEDGKKQP